MSDADHYRRRILRALRTVLTYSVSDAFDLTSEESAYLALVLSDLLSPSVLPDVEVTALPLAVRQEIVSGLYSGRLAARHARAARPASAAAGARTANADTWLQVLMDTITTTLALDVMTTMEIEARLRRLLLDLGVGHRMTPRASRYLPTSVRHLLHAA